MRQPATLGYAKEFCELRSVRDLQTTFDVPTHVHFFCHLLWKIHGGTLAVVVDLLDVLRAVWRPCIIFEVVPMHLGSDRSVELLALCAHVSVWRAFAFVADERPPLYAIEGGDFAAEATLWRFFFFGVPGALPRSALAVVVEDPLASLAVPPNFLFVTTQNLSRNTFQSSI